MGLIDDFFANGLSGWFGEAFGLLCAVGSLFGVFLFMYGVIRLVMKMTGFFSVKNYGIGPLILGLVLVSVFGWSFGLEYFEIYPM